MPSRPQAKDTPSSVTQLAAAMTALGQYRGANTPAEHAAEAKRLGGDNAYHVQLVNALLGAVQTEAILAETLSTSPDARQAVYEQQLKTCGSCRRPRQRIRFLRWQTLRVGGPLRQIAQNVEAGPIPLAAAHAAEGLQQLLGVIADSQNVTPADVDRLAGPVTDELRAAASHWPTPSATSTSCSTSWTQFHSDCRSSAVPANMTIDHDSGMAYSESAKEAHFTQLRQNGRRRLSRDIA